MAAIEGSTSENVLRKVGAKIVRVLSVDEAYQKLRDGSVDAVVVDAPATIYYAKNDKENRIEIVGEMFDKQKYGIAVCEGGPLREKINRAVLKIIESGRYDLYYKKWFGDDLTMEV